MLKNLTPHDIIIVNDEGTPIRVIPSSGVARCESYTAPATCDGKLLSIDGIPLSVTRYGNVTGLPDRSEPYNTNPEHEYIVSAMVAQANPCRDDIYIVNETVRDTNGRIVGCKSLSFNPWFDF